MATATTGYSWTSGEIVTPAKLNQMVNSSTITNIQAADLADGAVTQAKIGSITATGGSAARSLAERFGDVVNVKDFGATGNGTTDDSAAIQAAVNAALAKPHSAQTVFFPPGRFLIGTRITANIPNANYENGITIQGSGQVETQLLCAPNNTVGVLEIVGNANQEIMSVRDLRITSSINKDYATNNGTALLIRSSQTPGSSGWGSKPGYSAFVENVVIGGDAINSAQQFLTGNWLNGIVFQFVRRPVIQNCYITTCRRPDEPTSNNYSGLKFTDCYEYRADHVFVGGGYDVGIHANTTVTSGRQFEGGLVTRCWVVGPFTGVWQDHRNAPNYNTGPGLYEVGFHCLNNHINANNYGIRVSYAQEAILTGSYIYPASENVTLFSGNGSQTAFVANYNPPVKTIHVYVGDVLQTETTHYTVSQNSTANTVTITFVSAPALGTDNIKVVTSQRTVALAAGIFLDFASNVTVAANQFKQTGAFRSLDDASCGVILGATSQGCIITGNIFNHGGIGIKNLATEANANTVTGNSFDQGQKSWGTSFVPVDDPNRTLLLTDADAKGGTKNRNWSVFTNSTPISGQESTTPAGIVLQRSRTDYNRDYAQDGAATLGSLMFQGWTTTKEERVAAEIESRWLNGTNDSEYSAFRVWARSNGTRLALLDVNGGSSTTPAHVSTGDGELRTNGSTGPLLRFTSGTGSPEGNVSAVIGSIYLNRSGGASTTMYVKTSGSGNTGWTAK
jgi:hypothetical protein